MWSWFLARLKGIFNLFASFIIFIVLLVLVSSIIGAFTQPRIPSDMVLTIDLRNGLPDSSRNSFFGPDQRVGSVVEAVTALAAAEADERVKGAFIRVGGGGIAPSTAQELRAALKSFKAKGKFVISHAQAFYTGGMGDYMLAAAADEIWLQPVSEMNTLSRLGVTKDSCRIRWPNCAINRSEKSVPTTGMTRMFGSRSAASG